MSGVLSDVRVAAFTHFAAGPLTVQLLGSLGADVIKVEAPYRDLNRYAIVDPDGKISRIELWGELPVPGGRLCERGV